MFHMRNIVGPRVKLARSMSHLRITQAELATRLQLGGWNIDRSGVAYNYEQAAPEVKTLNNQPALRFDYQPRTSLRAIFKYAGELQRKQVFPGSVPGFNDVIVPKPIITTLSGTVNYTVNSTTFIEGSYGFTQNELAGCTTLMPGATGVVQEAGMPARPSISTRQSRQEPKASIMSEAQSFGTSMPASIAARMIEVPSGTVISRPSIVRVTSFSDFEAGVP